MALCSDINLNLQAAWDDNTETGLIPSLCSKCALWQPVVTLGKKSVLALLSFKKTEQRKKVKMENVRKLRYWKCFREGKVGRNRKTIKIQGTDGSKGEIGGCRKKRQGEWEEFSHHMGKGSMYIFLRAKGCALPLCEPAKTTLQNEICVGSYS